VTRHPVAARNRALTAARESLAAHLERYPSKADPELGREMARTLAQLDLMLGRSAC